MTNSYKIEFVSLDGIGYEIHIYPTATGYDSNNAEPLKGCATPITTEEDDDDDLILPLRPSTGYVSFVDETYDSRLLQEMTPESGDEISVDLVRSDDNSYAWRGYVQQQAFNQRWGESPLETELPIISRLGFMANKNLPDEAEGMVTIGSVLKTICGDKLNKVLLPLNDLGKKNSSEVLKYFPIDIQIAFNMEIFKDEIELDELNSITTTAGTKDKYNVKTYGEVLEKICYLFSWTIYEANDHLLIRDNTFDVAETYSYREYGVNDLTDFSYDGEQHLVTKTKSYITNENVVSANNEISGITPVNKISVEFGGDEWKVPIFSSSSNNKNFINYVENHSAGLRLVTFSPYNNEILKQFVYNNDSSTIIDTDSGHESILLVNNNAQRAKYGGGELVFVGSWLDTDGTKHSYTSIILAKTGNVRKKALSINSLNKHLFPSPYFSILTGESSYTYILISGNVTYSSSYNHFEFTDKVEDGSIYISAKVGDMYIGEDGTLSSSECVYAMPVKDGKICNNNHVGPISQDYYAILVKRDVPAYVFGQLTINLYTPTSDSIDANMVRIDGFEVNFDRVDLSEQLYNLPVKNSISLKETRTINNNGEGTYNIKVPFGVCGNSGMLFNPNSDSGRTYLPVQGLGEGAMSLLNPIRHLFANTFQIAQNIMQRERIRLKIDISKMPDGLDHYEDESGNFYRVYSSKRNWRDAQTNVTLIKMN